VSATVNDLEREAIRAHAAGEGWASFWQRLGDQVCQAEPIDRQRFHKLVRHLLALVVAGDTDGMTAAGAPVLWECDDAAASKSADVDTVARCLWPTTPRLASKISPLRTRTIAGKPEKTSKTPNGALQF